MIGGLIKSSRIAVLAGAGVIAGGLAISPAQAADLGGDCCADLEERVATLEATTVRKGNRKVSLTISGWVNTGLYIWDDGVDSDAYVVTENGTTLSTRITFSGSAAIDSDWSAGFSITIEPQSATPLLGVSQLTDDAGSNGAALTMLESLLYFKSKSLGKLSVGLQSHATDNIGVVDTLVVDAGGTVFTTLNPVFRGNNMILRTGAGNAINATTGVITPGGLAGAAGNNVAPAFGVAAPGNLTWGSFLQCHGLFGIGIGSDCNGVFTDSIRYDSPTIAGFTISASWGENDFYDVAVRYAGTFGDFRVGATFGYSDLQFSGSEAAGGDSQIYQAGFALMHVPTGIFVAGAYQLEEVDAVAGVNVAALSANFVDDPDSFYIKAGIKQRWNSLGATAIYGEYGIYNDQYTAAIAASGVTGSEVERYGVVIHQWIDAAALQVYAKWKHLELDTDCVAGSVAAANICAAGIEDLDQWVIGGVIFF